MVFIAVRLLSVLFLRHVTWAQDACSKVGCLFSSTNGHQLSGVSLRVQPSATKTFCTLLCLKVDSCVNAVFDSNSGTCAMDSSLVSDEVIYQIPASSILTLLHKKSYPGVWTLAFRAQKASDLDFWGTWSQNGRHDDDPSNIPNVPSSCLTMLLDPSCNMIFRSRWLDEWQDVQQVQIAFYTGGIRVAYVTFEAGESANKNEFMKPSKIVESSIDELNGPYSGTYNLIDVKGSEQFDRRFILSVQFNDCPGDRGWLFVAGGQKQNYCAYNVFSSYPMFLYTPTESSIFWKSTNPATADVFAVFLRMSP